MDFIRNIEGGPQRILERRVESILSWKYHETAETPGKPTCQSILATKELWLEKQMECLSTGWIRHPATGGPEECYESPNSSSASTSFYKHDAYPGGEL